MTGHLPDFRWGDDLEDSVIDWALVDTTSPPVTSPPSTTTPPTTLPVTLPDEYELSAQIVAGGLVYKAGKDLLVGRFWGEHDTRDLALLALDVSACTLEVFDEAGALVGGEVCLGIRDPVDPYHVCFVVRNPGLVAGINYIARVTLETLGAFTVGPRTFPMSVR